MPTLNAKIAITGATGFLGSHLLPLASQGGARLSCLARNPKIASLPNAAIIHGDCLNLSAMKELLSGKDIFIHMAALLFGCRWQDYFRANIRAAQIIVQALQEIAPEKRPAKMIFISSLAAAGPCAAAPGRAEKEAPAPVSAYGWSKYCCEQIFAAAPLKELAILRPPIIYGSGDRGLLPLFKSAARGLGISPGAFRQFPVSIIHAKDAAKAILLACGQKISGVFHLSDGKIYTMDEFCRAAANACGRGKCFVARPPLLLMAATASLSDAFYGWAAKAAARLKLKMPAPPHWNKDKYEEAKQTGWLADSEKFVAATGFTPGVDLQAGLRETVQGYRARGWL